MSDETTQLKSLNDAEAGVDGGEAAAAAGSPKQPMSRSASKKKKRGAAKSPRSAAADVGTMRNARRRDKDVWNYETPINVDATADGALLSARDPSKGGSEADVPAFAFNPRLLVLIVVNIIVWVPWFAIAQLSPDWDPVVTSPYAWALVGFFLLQLAMLAVAPVRRPPPLIVDGEDVSDDWYGDEGFGTRGWANLATLFSFGAQLPWVPLSELTPEARAVRIGRRKMFSTALWMQFTLAVVTMTAIAVIVRFVGALIYGSGLGCGGTPPPEFLSPNGLHYCSDTIDNTAALFTYLGIGILIKAVALAWHESPGHMLLRARRVKHLREKNPALFKLFAAIESRVEADQTGRKMSSDPFFFINRVVLPLVSVGGALSFIVDPWTFDDHDWSTFGQGRIVLFPFVLATAIALSVFYYVLFVSLCAAIRLPFHRNRERMRLVRDEFQLALQRGESTSVLKRIMQLRLMYDNEVLDVDYNAASYAVAGITFTGMASMLMVVIMLFLGRPVSVSMVQAGTAAVLLTVLTLSLLWVGVSAVKLQDAQHSRLQAAALLRAQLLSQTASWATVAAAGDGDAPDDKLQQQREQVELDLAVIDRFVAFASENRPYPQVFGLMVRPTLYRLLAGYFAASAAAILANFLTSAGDSLQGKLSDNQLLTAILEQLKQQTMGGIVTNNSTLPTMMTGTTTTTMANSTSMS